MTAMIRNIARISARAAMDRAHAKEKWHSIVPKRPDKIDWSYLREQLGRSPTVEERRAFSVAYEERIEEERAGHPG
jgi:hypothetical protein